MCSGRARLGEAVDSKLSMQIQISSGDAEKSQDPFIRTILCFSSACDELNWNHERSTPHRSETHDSAERAVRRVKEGTLSVLVQSGLQES